MNVNTASSKSIAQSLITGNAAGIQRTTNAPGHRSPFESNQMDDKHALGPKVAVSPSNAKHMPDEVMKAIVDKAKGALGKPAGGGPEAGPTIEEFMKAWGSGDKRFDLNADGTVNVDDLMQFIAEQTQGIESMDSPGAMPQYIETPAPLEGIESDEALIMPDDMGKTKGSGTPGGEPLGEPGGEADRVQQLKDAWGTDNPEFDLNGDGIVGVDDLLQLLAENSDNGADVGASTDAGAAFSAISPAPAPSTSNSSGNALGTDAISAGGASTASGATPPPGATDTTLPVDSSGAIPEPTMLDDTGTAGEVQTPMQQFMEAWGSDNPEFDLNNDGIVDVDDLLQFIEQNENAGTASGQPLVGEDPAPQASPVEQLMEAWGSDDPNFDLNGDGTVNILDLLQMLAEQSNQQPPLGAPGDLFNSPFGASNMADMLYQELSANGHAEQPPLNLNELIDRLAPNQVDKQSILEKISQFYPNGLGVNYQS